MSNYTICIFGSGGVGKSCLTMQFVDGVFVQKYDPTIEDVYKKDIEVDEKKYSLEIFDTAGSDEFSAMRDSYVKSGHGFVLVYSITSQATFNDLTNYYERIMNVKENDRNGPPAMVVVGNKTDLANERVVSRETGHGLANRWQCSFLETSAKDRNSVNEIFFDLIRQLNGRNQSKPAQQPPTRGNGPSSEPQVDIHNPASPSQPSVQNVTKESKCCVLL